MYEPLIIKPDMLKDCGYHIIAAVQAAAKQSTHIC